VDVGLGDRTTETAAVTGARTYRRLMAELAPMSQLEEWYHGIDLAKLIEEPPEKATRGRRTKMLHNARGRVGESVFPRPNDSAVAAFAPTRPRKGVNKGDRVLGGQHLLQAAGDSVQGSFTSPAGRDNYARRPCGMKVAVPLWATDRGLMTQGAASCPMAVDRAHANTGSVSTITGCHRNSEELGNSLGWFGLADDAQTVRGHEALVDVIDNEGVLTLRHDLAVPQSRRRGVGP
jgi:hypothetical protein